MINLTCLPLSVIDLNCCLLKVHLTLTCLFWNSAFMFMETLRSVLSPNFLVVFYIIFFLTWLSFIWQLQVLYLGAAFPLLYVEASRFQMLAVLELVYLISYFLQDPGSPPARRIWTSINVGTEIYVSRSPQTAEWTVSDFDVLVPETDRQIPTRI